MPLNRRENKSDYFADKEGKEVSGKVCWHGQQVSLKKIQFLFIHALYCYIAGGTYSLGSMMHFELKPEENLLEKMREPGCSLGRSYSHNRNENVDMKAFF